MPIKLALDVYGGEAHISEPIRAALKFLKKNKDVIIYLVGPAEEIKRYANGVKNIVIIDATKKVSTTDSYITYLRNTESSLYICTKLLADKKVDGILSNSTTAAFVMVTTSLIGTIPGVSKSAFMSYIPTLDKKGVLLLDEGANVRCNANELVQFAKMANIYASKVRGIKSPKVNLLNIGTEDNKGTEELIEANQTLKGLKNINYQGFIEGGHVLTGESDIIVTDGFTGNIELKTLEGTLKQISKLLKREYKKPWNMPGCLLSLSVIKQIKKTFNYKNYAAAFVMGLNGVVCKSHGNADCQEFYSSLGMLYSAVINNLPALIKENI